MAFDIQPPNRQRRMVPEQSKPQPVKKVVPKPKPVAPAPKPVPVKPKPVKVTKPKPVQPKPAKVKKVKKNNASKTGAIISWIALFVVLGAVGYLVWQEENKNAELEKENPTKSGIIETFPGQNQNPEPNESAVPQENEGRQMFMEAEQEFDQEFQNLNENTLEPTPYEDKEWEDINKYLNDF